MNKHKNKARIKTLVLPVRAKNLSFEGRMAPEMRK